MRSSQEEQQTYIFNITADQCPMHLTKQGDWLIRDSATAPGLLVLSIMTSPNHIAHLRFGLTDKGWETAPGFSSQPKAPESIMDAQAQARYREAVTEHKVRLAAQKNALISFNTKSNELFTKPDFVESCSQQLLPLLLKQEFKINKQTLNPSVENLKLPDKALQTRQRGYMSSYSVEDVEKARLIGSSFGNIKPNKL